MKQPPDLARLPLDFTAPEDGFLGLDVREAARPEDARVWVVPFGLETSVTYEGGTGAGPAAMIAASHEVELFDEGLWREPVRDWGLATVAAPPIANGLEPALEQLSDIVQKVRAAKKFPMVFGGEHAITPAIVRETVRKKRGLVVLQFDAHADLRDGYRGEKFSHASAMRRCLDIGGVEVVGVGIRNISAEEIPDYDRFTKEGRLKIFWAKDKAEWSLKKLKKRLKGRDIHITFDVDGFDASLMPATGTPEPGGLFWDDVLPILKLAGEVGRVVSADVNELAPRPGLHACDFTAARLAYKILSYALGPS